MKKIKLTFCIIFIITNLFGQKTTTVYLDATDSTRNNYTIIYPPKLPWKGYLVLLPGFGETAERVFEQTELPKTAAQNGLFTIIPSLQDGPLSFGIDSLSQSNLELIIQDIRSKHKLLDLPFYIGGFSIGGSCAIKYAENTSVKPSAIFAIDPPLDFERFYYSSERNVRLSINENPNQESVYMLERIEKEFNGTPRTALSNYHSISPYSFSDASQTALKKIIKTPIRIYSEPDVLWWLKERSSDLTNMNVTECSAMINELLRLGNNKAELIITQNKGYRKPNNTRHPHSWSIVDNKDLINWLLKQR